MDGSVVMKTADCLALIGEGYNGPTMQRLRNAIYAS